MPLPASTQARLMTHVKCVILVFGHMKTINLNKTDKYAVVDDDDFIALKKYQWKLWTCGNGKEYVGRDVFENGQYKPVLMHRQLLNAEKGLSVDHINGDGLDNRKINIRICTHKENMRNRKIHKNNTSGFRGVYPYKYGWRAQIKVDGKIKHLGSSKNRIDLAKIYNQAAIKYFGEFARLNFA